MLGILVGVDLKDSFMRDSYASHTVFPSFGGRPMMLDIMAGPDEKDICEVHPCHDAEAVSHGPDCSAGHGDSPVAL